MRRAAVSILVACGLVTAACSDPSPTNTPEPSPSVSSTPDASEAVREVPTVEITEVADIVTGLDAPWAIGFLPDGRALVTERDSAQILLVDDGRAAPMVGPGADEVRSATLARSEGGLLGLAVSPQFETDGTVFVYVTTANDNRILALEFDGDNISAAEPIVTGIPRSGNHNGGRLAFSPDGDLFATTGDASRTELSQDPESLGGKILRVTDGDRVLDPPQIWSLGHRNVQGLDWAVDGRLFASEFGQNTWDELNLIDEGGNYGWPEAEGRDGSSDGLVEPLVQWSTSDASPSGVAVTTEGIYLASLRGQRLWRVPFAGDGVGEPQELLTGYGRLRDVVVAPDGSLWVLTNNTDGRGSPGPGDDRILRITLTH